MEMNQQINRVVRNRGVLRWEQCPISPFAGEGGGGPGQRLCVHLS